MYKEMFAFVETCIVKFKLLSKNLFLRACETKLIRSFKKKSILGSTAHQYSCKNNTYSIHVQMEQKS